MKQKTFRDLWRYCYRQARQINSYLNAAKLEMEAGNTAEAMRLAMVAGELITRAETGYSSDGSVYVYRQSDSVEFDVYTTHADRYEFVFSFGDNTPRNKQAEANRCEWQKQAQSAGRIFKREDAHSEIAFYLSFMDDEDFFKAYDAIKRIAEATR